MANFISSGITNVGDAINFFPIEGSDNSNTFLQLVETNMSLTKQLKEAHKKIPRSYKSSKHCGAVHLPRRTQLRPNGSPRIGKPGPNAVTQMVIVYP